VDTCFHCRTELIIDEGLERQQYVIDSSINVCFKNIKITGE
jgi:hypothetical protein